MSAALSLLAVLIDTRLLWAQDLTPAAARPSRDSAVGSSRATLTRTPPLSPGSSIAITFAQSSASNWVGAPASFLTASISALASESLTAGPLAVRLNLSLRLGATYVGDSSVVDHFRVSDNEFFGEVVGSYPLRWRVDPYVSSSLRSPVTEAHHYLGTVRTRTAAFWDPVVTQQSMGFAYENRSSREFCSIRIGISANEVRAVEQTMLSDDPNTPEKERYRIRAGVEFAADATVLVDSSMTYTGRLASFGGFSKLDLWTVHSEHELRIRFWKVFGLIASVTILYDTRLSLRTQVRESISVGIVHTF